MIVRIVKMHFREEAVETFLRLFNKTNAKISTFPGCEKLQLLRLENNGNVFFTYSYWDSEEALTKYRNSELFREIWSQTKILFQEKAEAWTSKIEFES